MASTLFCSLIGVRLYQASADHVATLTVCAPH